MGFKEFHKVRLAVVGKGSHIVDGDMFGVMLFYIFQYGLHLFKRLRLGGRRGLFFIAVRYQKKKELEEVSLYGKLISFGAGRTQQIDLTDVFCRCLIIRQGRG